MSVVSIFGHDAGAEARALLKVAAWGNQQTAQPMRESDQLLQTILEAGDLVGRDDAGRMVIQLAVEPRDFDRLMAFGADAVEAEDGGDGEPYQCPPMSASTRQALISPLAIRRRTVLVEVRRISAASSIRCSLGERGWRSFFISRVRLRVSQPMQLLARGLACQQANERRDRSVDIGCAISTVHRLSRRPGVLR
jgi:hypothetical protein